MAFRTSCVALLLASLPIAGCGTVTNLVKLGPEEGAKIPFGGVKQDVVCMKAAANGQCGSNTQPKPGCEQRPQVVRVLYYATDLPFSFLGDVVTWPYTATYTYINQETPFPPIIQSPGSPPPQATADGQPQPQAQPSPMGTLPEPGKLP